MTEVAPMSVQTPRNTAVPIEDLPEWANFLATDRNGDVFVYESRPEAFLDSWGNGRRTKQLSNIGKTINWRETLLDLRPLRAAAEAKAEAEGYCTDCESNTVLTDGRCACGSGRVITDPASDYFGQPVGRARQAAEKAIQKYPQPNYVALKIAEEAGEVVRGAVHYAEGRMQWEEVEGEIVQLLAMLIRFVTEGDQVLGALPPGRVAVATEVPSDD